MFQWWWMKNESYTIDEALPQEIRDYAGPRGVALVKAYNSGATDKGWGDKEFMENYQRNRFNERRALVGYDAGKNHFAIVMRSVKLVCIDIDGKNGGIDHAAELLGNVPLTLAETSKSGNGYHLYFWYEDKWDDTYGYGELTDAIGIVQGVDVRVTGCVYHYNTQRWNNQPITKLPTWIESKLRQRQHRKDASIHQVIQTAKSGGWEALMQIENLLEELAKPIKAGKRNNTLFAIGSKLMLAGYEEWSEVVSDRAQEVGLDAEEISKLATNIDRYGKNYVE
nr:MAG TPA_asm: Bifunctional DNA primase polymerase [Caudoviricetes sp.]